ncbi:Hypothetical protein GLP15_124 [Giardia lamblia P15]|uniref:Uncharacterized protein n=1 Tax=Giardia intestinalis (strain P15) TaxID=658858 RepID=E1EWZ8_GIAIA|nr:Hypothetical protein GLP15_124 [Giardia lamblia P15]
MRYFRELMANKSQKGSSLSFQTLNECVNMMLHGVVLGNILQRYGTGTLFLCSTLLAPACSLGYLWVKSYHSLAEIYSAITVELRSDSDTFCNPKHSIRGLTFEDSGKLCVDEEAVRGRIRYGDNGRLEQYPFIYQVALPEKTIQAVYVARTCQLCSQLHKGADSCTSTDEAARVFNIQLAEAEFNTYMLREAYRARTATPGSLAFYVSWTHPSVSLHLDAAQCITECLLDLYYRRFDEMSPNFNALALGRCDKLRLPYRSCTCYGYAAVSDRDPSYIEDAMRSVHQALAAVHRAPAHLRLSPASSADPRIGVNTIGSLSKSYEQQYMRALCPGESWNAVDDWRSLCDHRISLSRGATTENPIVQLLLGSCFSSTWTFEISNLCLFYVKKKISTIYSAV